MTAILLHIVGNGITEELLKGFLKLILTGLTFSVWEEWIVCDLNHLKWIIYP